MVEFELVSTFLGIKLFSCGFHGCQIKENSYSFFDYSIKSETSSIIDLYKRLEFTGFRTNSEVSFRV